MLVATLLESLVHAKRCADKVSFVNIETPGTPRRAQTDQDRVENFEFISQALQAPGLRCCGNYPAAAEQKIEQGLALSKAQ